MTERDVLTQCKTWVVKIGSALLTANGEGLDRELMAAWVEQIAALREQGKTVIIVSSGAVAEGMARLGWKQRPTEMDNLQAAAALGQMGLVQAWETKFQRHGLKTAQILLTHDDLSNRTRYLNARGTLLALLRAGVIPVVNENDTVVTDEIRFGDNDTLAALVANLVGAEGLLILTDQNGLFDADPRNNPDAKLIEQAKASDPVLEQVATGSKSGLGRGGMITKVRAAQLAARSGTRVVIASGRADRVIDEVAKGASIGTLLLPDKEPENAKKQWLAGHLQMKGELVLDDGAVSVLKKKGTSLLAVGVKEVRGQFDRGEMVACLDLQGNRIACGLSNYDADAASKIAGKKSAEIESILGYLHDEELINRDNLVLM